MPVQEIRFRRPQSAKPSGETASKRTVVEEGLLKEQLRRTNKPPWNPGFSVAFRMILLIRWMAAMYGIISDCDETYNYWEPLHYLQQGTGFQTWEYSPAYSIRSWSYILLHLLPVKVVRAIFPLDKRPTFFAVRLTLSIIASLIEAKVYRSVVEKVNVRVGRYFLFMMLTSAGMWNASTNFLPSTFAMYFVTLGFAFAVKPVSNDNRRTYLATLFFAISAIVGWPFSVVLAVPFVIEELFVVGLQAVPEGQGAVWARARFQRLFLAGMLGLLTLVPVVAIDYLAYGKLVIVPLNIIKYNVFADSSRGPDLYGTEPPSYYILNGILNFNILFPLALASLPALAITNVFDYRRLGGRPSPGQSSPYTIMSLRLLPFYLWFGLLTAQAHKEERFMFPAFPLVCFNAATTLYLSRGWFERAFIKITSSPYRAAHTSLFSTWTRSIIMFSAFLSILRITAIYRYYHAPMDVLYHFQTYELPRLGFSRLPSSFPAVNQSIPFSQAIDQLESQIDLSPLRQLNLTLCYGKEWHRFPTSFLVPEQVRIEFIRSEFKGILPKHFGVVNGTRVVPEGFNDLNREEPDRYVPVETCSYLIDVDFPHRYTTASSTPSPTEPEPRFAVQTDEWDRVFCAPFLDNENSPRLTRTLWLPSQAWTGSNRYGDYCLLRNRRRLPVD